MSFPCYSYSMRKQKNGALLVIAGVAAALIGVYTYFSLGAGTMRVAFYGLPEPIVRSLSSWLDTQGTEWKAFVLDDTKPLRAHIAKTVQYDLLFTYDGANMDSVEPIVRNAETAVLQTLPFPIRVAVQTDGRLTGTPLLSDPFELLCSKKNFNQLNAAPTPFSLARLEALGFEKKSAQERSSAAPFLCAGKDDTHLLMFFSSLLEAQEGIEAFSEATYLLKENPDGVFSSFFASAAVKRTVERIGLWQKYGLLPHEWLQLNIEDAALSAEKEQPLVVFAPLSFYRSLSEGASRKYTLWFMPSQMSSAKRFLIADTVAALQFSVPKSPFQNAAQATEKLAKGRALIREAASAAAQAALVSSTRLLPVNAEVQTDVPSQSALRYVTAADGIMPGIAQAVFVSKDDTGTFAQLLRERIQKAAE